MSRKIIYCTEYKISYAFEVRVHSPSEFMFMNSSASLQFVKFSKTLLFVMTNSNIKQQIVVGLRRSRSTIWFSVPGPPLTMTTMLSLQSWCHFYIFYKHIRHGHQISFSFFGAHDINSFGTSSLLRSLKLPGSTRSNYTLCTSSINTSH